MFLFALFKYAPDKMVKKYIKYNNNNKRMKAMLLKRSNPNKNPSKYADTFLCVKNSITVQHFIKYFM